MTTLSYTVPVAGTDPNSTADPEIATALTSIKTWANGNVDGANVNGTLTGRRLVGEAVAFIGGSFGTGGLLYQVMGDNTVLATGTATAKALLFWTLDPSTFSVVGKANTQMVMRTTYLCGVAPNTTIGAQLNAITSVSTSTSNYIANIGSMAGSSGSVNLTGNGSFGSIEGSTFTFPSTGSYLPLISLGNTTAANCSLSLMIQMFVLNS